MAITWNDLKSIRETKCPKLKISRKKDVYIFISYLLFIFVSAALFSDLVCLYITQSVEHTTQNLSMALLFIHTVGFYMGILGFVYTTQCAGAAVKTPLASILCHIVVFSLRVAMELCCLGYRKEYYRTAMNK